MTDAGIRITILSDWASVDAELSRLAGMPDPVMEKKLELVLNAFVASAKAITHVITGSLKNSGRAEILPPQNENEWVGQLHFGGPSPGFPHDPVTYAAFERSKQISSDRPSKYNKGDHDFLAGAYQYTDIFAETVRDGLQGDE